MMRGGRHTARSVENKTDFRVEVGKSERKNPLGRLRRRWEDIKMVPKEERWEGMDWIHLPQNTDDAGARVQNAENFLTRGESINRFSRRDLLHEVR